MYAFLRQRACQAACLTLLMTVSTVSQAQSTDRSTSSIPLNDIKAKAGEIDAILAKAWAENDVKGTGRISEENFLRRTYLTIAGRIPTLEETVIYLKRPSRSALIDKLLDSEGHVHRQFNFWADLLRARSDQEGLGGPYIKWLKESIRNNKPYDQFVKELVSAEGWVWENGAAGYWMRDYRMPLDALSNTVQVFLGTRIQCAQCHDHPFDKWTQMEYYELASFTYGVDTNPRDIVPKGVAEANGKYKRGDALYDAVRNLTDDFDKAVKVSARDIQLPHNYKYKDGKPGQAVKPMTILGDMPEISSGDHGRLEAFASWISNKDTPRFTTTITNRLWKQVFGRGLIEPVDDMTDDTKADIPELMTYLEKQFVEMKFDTKQFLRMLYNTQAYQSATIREDIAGGDSFYFQGPVLKRMSAEQFWDSLITLIIPDPDEREGGIYQDGAVAKFRTVKNKSASEIIAMAGKNGGQMMGMMGGDRPKTANDPRWKDYDGSLVRASEKRSPDNLGSFLRQFGQSDREAIDNYTDDPNVSQVLEMFNGYMFEQVTSPKAVVWQNLDKFSRNKVQALFLSVLNRKPSSGEERFTGKIMSMKNKNEGYGAVIWALLNTRQFSFVD